jgi:hypothetical protein
VARDPGFEFGEQSSFFTGEFLRIGSPLFNFAQNLAAARLPNG